MANTAWGKAKVIERVSVEQTNEERTFETHVELLETDEGERLVRFGYATDGAIRRGPVTLRLVDLRKLKRALARSPDLRAALDFVN